MIKIFYNEKIPNGFKGKLLVLREGPEYMTPDFYQYLGTAKGCDYHCLDWTLVEDYCGKIMVNTKK